MNVIPAIDIKDGKVVRLARGDFKEMTVYSEDPVRTAQQWEACGARLLHIVDLDGALSGASKNFEVISRIAASVKIPIQLGGGVRSKYDIARLLSGGGVAKVILGTKAVENREFLKEVLAEWGNQLIVSLDCADGMVAVRGWTEVSDVKAVDFARDMEQLGVACLIYTDIGRDGMLNGPNIEKITELLTQIKIPVIASGGVSTLEDIRQLIPLAARGLTGVITGKAIYEGRLDLKEAIRICSLKE